MFRSIYSIGDRSAIGHRKQKVRGQDIVSNFQTFPFLQFSSRLVLSACRTLWNSAAETSLKVITDQKAATLAAVLIEDGRALLNMFKQDSIKPGAEFLGLIEKCKCFTEVAFNMESNPEVQSTMHAISTSVKEECDWKCPASKLGDLASWWGQQWQNAPGTAADGSEPQPWALKVSVDDNAAVMLDVLEVRGHGTPLYRSNLNDITGHKLYKQFCLSVSIVNVKCQVMLEHLL